MSTFQALKGLRRRNNLFKKYQELSGKVQAVNTGSTEGLSIQKEIDTVLDWFRTAPDVEVVTVKFLK